MSIETGVRAISIPYGEGATAQSVQFTEYLPAEEIVGLVTLIGWRVLNTIHASAVSPHVHFRIIEKAGMHFGSDLMRSVSQQDPTLSTSWDTVTVTTSNWGNSTVVRAAPARDPLPRTPTHVVVSDVLVGTGRTLEWVLNGIRQEAPPDVEIIAATLLDRGDFDPTSLGLNSEGFVTGKHQIGRGALIGYGLDFSGTHSSHSGIYISDTAVTALTRAPIDVAIAEQRLPSQGAIKA